MEIELTLLDVGVQGVELLRYRTTYIGWYRINWDYI